MKLFVAGIDPSLANTGLAKGYYDVTTGELRIDEIALVETDRDNSRQVRRNSDDLRRAKMIVDQTRLFIGEGVSTIFAEVPTGSQSARGSFSNGICVGTLAALEAIVQVTPTEVKLAATGSKVADKVEMIEWAVARWPHLPWLKHRGKLQRKNEHMADACAAINAGLQTDQFKQLVQAIRIAR